MVRRSSEISGLGLFTPILLRAWAVGNLNGLYGYGVDIYGAAFGKYVNNCSFLTIDPTNGIRMIWKNGLGANVEAGPVGY